MTYKYYCEKCDRRCRDTSDFDKHIRTKKHNSCKNDFTCNACNYTCSIQSVMDRHINTQKHKVNQEKLSEPEPSKDKEQELITIIHKLLTDNSELKNFIIEQARDHKNDTKELIIEMSKNNHGNTNINSNNALNINMYLNEQCKDAINFSDFIQNIEVTREDLENNAQLGFVGGISKILIDRLRLLDAADRPMHCTDLKREIMYIKDDGKWNKEENDSKMRSAIQTMTRKSVGALLVWKKENTDYMDSDSAFSQRCIVIQQQSMAGGNRDLYYSKVIRTVAKEVLVIK